MKNNFKNNYNPKYTQISLYVISTAVIIFLLIAIANHMGGIFIAIGTGLRWIGKILTPLLAGFVIAYLLYPLVNFFQRKIEGTRHFQKTGKTARGLSVLITVVLALAAVIVLFSVVISTLTDEIRMINLDDISNFVTNLVDNIQDFFRQLNNWLDNLNISSTDMSDYLKDLGDKGIQYAQNIGTNMMNSLTHIGTFFTNLIFAIIFSIYFMLDGSNLKRYWNRVLKAISSRRFYRGFHIFLSDADKVFSGYIRGQLLDALLMFVAVSFVLSLIGVRFAVIIGLLTGIGNLIPYLGPFIAYLSTILVCLLNGDIRRLITAIVILFIVQTIDGNIVNPKLLSSSIEVHPMLVIVALLIGSAIGGILGMLLAVPVAALLKIQFDRLISFLMKKRKIEG